MRDREPLPEDTAHLNTILQRMRVWLADRRFHEFLWYCVPGILVATALRAWLMAVMPYGYYHPDTHDFLTSVYELETRHRWTVHGKTTFLTPLLYTLAFFPKVPALVVIPLAQHLRGLLLVLAVGALARLWFARWRWFIVPLTILTGALPAMIFWEHTLMSESGFVFCAVMLALAGTFFTRQPGRLSYGLLLAAMACVAAARPEGNLWQGVGIVLVLILFWGRWKLEWRKIAGAFAVALTMFTITKTSHSGLLLYSSLVHLTPDEPRAVPGFGPYIRPLREKMLAQRQEQIGDDVVRASRRVTEALMAYAKDHPRAKLGLTKNSKRRKPKPGPVVDPDALEYDLQHSNNTSTICRRLAIECALAHPWALPSYAWHKFLVPINSDSGGTFDDYVFHQKQAFSITGKGDMSKVLAPGLIGAPLDTPEQARAFVDAHFPLDKVEWFNTWDDHWLRAIGYSHLPDNPYSATYQIPGLPVYYLLAMLGALVSLFRVAPAQRFHWAFVPVVAGAGFIVMLTAAVIPRHRFVWEPFWLLYGFYFLDSVCAGVAWMARRSTGSRPAAVIADPVNGRASH